MKVFDVVMIKKSQVSESFWKDKCRPMDLTGGVVAGTFLARKTGDQMTGGEIIVDDKV